MGNPESCPSKEIAFILLSLLSWRRHENKSRLPLLCFQSMLLLLLLLLLINQVEARWKIMMLRMMLRERGGRSS